MKNMCCEIWYREADVWIFKSAMYVFSMVATLLQQVE